MSASNDGANLSRTPDGFERESLSRSFTGSFGATPQDGAVRRSFAAAAQDSAGALLYRPLPMPLSSKLSLTHLFPSGVITMKRYAFALAIAGLILASGALADVEQPRIVPRSARIDKPAEQVFSTLKRYFSDPTLSMFRLVNADPGKLTLIATRDSIDDENWTNWAACQAQPLEMLYKLEDGTVKVTVQLERSGNTATFASVTADFQGKYGLGSSETTIDCISRGGLEQSILTVAGAETKASTQANAAGH
jgi:hypothetical protein